jgi:hypothetical protein
LAREDVLLSPKARTSVALLTLAAILAAANAWVAASRSTIPLALDDIVVGKQVRLEKHPSQDDVYLVDLQSRGLIQVDPEFFKSIEIGDHPRKKRWSRKLDFNDRRVMLDWSTDTKGMVRAMPIAWCLMLALAIWICRRG